MTTTFITIDDFTTSIRESYGEEDVEEAIRNGCHLLLIEVPELATATLSPDQASQLKTILNIVIRRWLGAGDGVVVSHTAPGGYQETLDSSRVHTGVFFSRELEQVRKLLKVTKDVQKGAAFQLELAGPSLYAHDSRCDFWNDPNRCTCGLVLSMNGRPANPGTTTGVPVE